MNKEETVARLVNALGLAIEHMDTKDKFITSLTSKVALLEEEVKFLEDRVATLLTTVQKPLVCNHSFVTVEYGQLRSIEKCSKCGEIQFGRGNY